MQALTSLKALWSFYGSLENDLNFVIANVNSAPLLDSYGREQTSTTSSPHMAFQKPQEPNIDFELDVKVLINSGKCVLHTKDPGREDELKL